MVLWDGDAPRPRTEEEALSERKAAKVDELAACAVEEIAPLFTPSKGRDEALFLVAGHVLRLCEALGVQPDPRLRTVVETGERALAKKAEVEASASPEEVEAVGCAVDPFSGGV